MTDHVKRTALLGVLLAAQIVAGRFITISLPIVKIGFTFLPIAMTGILFGPFWCAVSAALGDILTALLSGYGYYPPMTISAILTGLIYGLLLYQKPASLKRISLAVLLESIPVSTFLQCYWLMLLTGKGYLVLLPSRIIQNLIMIPISILCIRYVAYPILERLPQDLRPCVFSPVSTPCSDKQKRHES